MGFFEDEAKEAVAFEAELEAESTSGDVVSKPEPQNEEPQKQEESPQVGESVEPGPEGEEKSKPEGRLSLESEQEKPQDEEEQQESKEVTEKKAPPEGYVEIGAMKEARKKEREYRSKSEQLEAENNALLLEVQRLMNEKQATVKEDDFKELTEKELEDLREEDPEAYTDYRFRLMESKEKKRLQQEEAAKAQAIDRMAMKEVNEVGTQIDEMLKDVETVKTLIDYGTEFGFSQADLAALSQPQTKIVTGDGKTRYLGKAALTFIKHLDAARNVNRDSLKAEIEKEHLPGLEERITRQVLEKVKTQTPQQPSLDGQSDKGVKPLPDDLTEAQFAKLSPEDKERWLRQ